MLAGVLFSWRDTHAKQVESRGQTKSDLAGPPGWGLGRGLITLSGKKKDLLQKPKALCATRHKEDRWRWRFPKTGVMFPISLRYFTFVPLFPNPLGDLLTILSLQYFCCCFFFHFSPLQQTLLFSFPNITGAIHCSKAIPIPSCIWELTAIRMQHWCLWKVLVIQIHRHCSLSMRLILPESINLEN